MKVKTKLPRKPRSVGFRREEILAVALKLFSEHGMHAVTTRQIASAVGISQPSLYAFFPNKQALETEVGTRAFEELTSHITKGLDALKRGTCDIRDLGKIYVDFGLAHPDAYRLAFMVEKPSQVATVNGSEDPILAAGLKAFYLLREAVYFSFGARLKTGELELLLKVYGLRCMGSFHFCLPAPTFRGTSETV